VFLGVAFFGMVRLRAMEILVQVSEVGVYLYSSNISVLEILYIHIYKHVYTYIRTYMCIYIYIYTYIG